MGDDRPVIYDIYAKTRDEAENIIESLGLNGDVDFYYAQWTEDNIADHFICSCALGKFIYDGHWPDTDGSCRFSTIHGRGDARYREERAK